MQNRLNLQFEPYSVSSLSMIFSAASATIVVVPICYLHCTSRLFQLIFALPLLPGHRSHRNRDWKLKNYPVSITKYLCGSEDFCRCSFLNSEKRVINMDLFILILHIAVVIYAT